MNFLGGYQFESNNEKDFIGKRRGWRNDAIRDGWGVVFAEDLVPENSSGNTVEVTATNYTINGTTTSHSGDWEYVFGGRTDSVNSENNKLIINGGKITYWSFGGWSGGNNATVNGNTYTLNSGEVLNIYGGWLHYFTTNGTASGNIVNINGGTVIGEVRGAEVSYGTAENNTVNISGGIIKSHVFGGYTNNGNYAESSLDTTSVVKNNTINISGGTIEGNIFGGWAYNCDAINNTVNISGSPNISASEIFGAYSTDGQNYGYDYARQFFSYNGDSPHNVKTGNTLNIYTKNLTAKNIYNFQNINFYLPSTTVNGDTILTLTDSSTDISGAYVRAGVIGNANLKSGDVVTLLQNAGTITTNGTTYGKLTEGVSLTYDLTVSKSGDNKIIATIGSVSDSGGSGGYIPSDNQMTIPDNPLNPDIEIIKPETMNFILPEPPDIPFDTFEEFDLEADDKKEMGVEDTPEQKGWEIFADIGGGSMKYKGANGSRVDTTNQNANMGFARNVGNMANKMTIAPIIDYQNTNYDNYLSDGTHGRGNSKYTGGGFVLRNMNHNGFYCEGSFRAGRVKTDFASDNLDTTGMFGTVTYNNSATVLNGHIKLGKYLRLNKNNLLDIYGFYYHTHQGGSSADLSSGEHYDFSSANAGRARIGYRLTTRTSKISQIYTGLAYQYEHNSGITASYKGYSTSGASHGGSSSMLEIGWIVKPLKNNPWTVNVNATGWIGNQRGIKALAKVQKSF